MLRGRLDRTNAAEGTSHAAAGASERRVTVLQIIPRLDGGGAERTTVEICEALTAVGARALVASEGGRLAAAVEQAGGEVIAFPAASKNPLRLIANALALARLIRRRNIDLLHARSRAPAWSALWAARATGRAFVTTYHGAYASKGALKTFYNSVMARGDLVIANSHFTAARIARLHKVAGEQVHVIHRGLDPDVFDPRKIGEARRTALLSEWGLPAEHDRPLLLLPGRITRQKGHLTAIDALAALDRKTDPRPLLILAGGDQGHGAYRAEIEARAAALGLSEQVMLVGHCADIAAAYALADCVLVPSLLPEAFGRTAAEAQAMGVPVIASDIGAIAETVLAPPQTPAAERTGWRVPPGDARALAGALREALSLPHNQRRELAARGRTHVLASFTLARMVSRTLRVYDLLLGTHLAPPLDESGGDAA